MKLTTTTFWQIVTLLALAGDQYSSVVPVRYKPAVTAIAGIAVILLHWHAGVHDPDGTRVDQGFGGTDIPEQRSTKGERGSRTADSNSNPEGEKS